MIYKKLLYIFLVLLSLRVGSEEKKPENHLARFKAVIFDYFVIFDANSVVSELEKVFPGKGSEFARIWRAKQFEYCFLLSVTNRHEDFLRLTEDALVYTANFMKLKLSSENKSRFLQTFLTLKPWPDAIQTLEKLKKSGLRIIVLSNFSGKMLKDNANHAGISHYFEQLISTEVDRSYKPDPIAYELGRRKLGLKKEEILFVAFGGWDVYGAKNFGYTTYWVNRFQLPVEELGLLPDATSQNLEGLSNFILNQK
ncbi:haloacid dehalogenase, type II [Leptospira perolatii]|uniref:Haloacid dehalogenase, type II n=1 Tax=Leptospira perolatii TaxID=2023191 RepID=A0A2M9ZJB0_9LEPT|nr:haloacid dehalogenase type II [Leptospira perolatii]PJZ68815.1 haloacid dehalogenase, type II [Leptospira perolatii]PJZ72146.1 haloacid dehalogenase, type II [Leptospira perolatii]